MTDAMRELASKFNTLFRGWRKRLVELELLEDGEPEEEEEEEAAAELLPTVFPLYIFARLESLPHEDAAEFSIIMYASVLVRNELIAWDPEGNKKRREGLLSFAKPGHDKALRESMAEAEARDLARHERLKKLAETLMGTSEMKKP